MGYGILKARIHIPTVAQDQQLQPQMQALRVRQEQISNIPTKTRANYKLFEQEQNCPSP